MEVKQTFGSEVTESHLSRRILGHGWPIDQNRKTLGEPCRRIRTNQNLVPWLPGQTIASISADPDIITGPLSTGYYGKIYGTSRKVIARAIKQLIAERKIKRRWVEQDGEDFFSLA